MKVGIYCVFILFLIFSSYTNAHACWCRKDPSETNTPQKLRKVVLNELRRSDAVFSAQVTEITDKDIKLKVTKVWKGEIAEEEIAISRWYYVVGKQDKVFIECSFQRFAVGKSYLFYAKLFEEKLQVLDCSRSRFLNEAGTDVAILDSWKSDSKK